MTVINKKKYTFNKYNSEYPKMFEREKARIKKVFPKDLIIEHVGSTAIPGLGGKGIIDIAIKTPKNKLEEFTRKLQKLGYARTLEHQPNENRIFFQRIIKSRGKERRIHLHLTLNDYFWNTFIAFRDYLRSHNEEREKYAKLKKEAVKHAKGEGKKYRAYKNKFLESLTKKAMKEMK